MSHTRTIPILRTTRCPKCGLQTLEVLENLHAVTGAKHQECRNPFCNYLMVWVPPLQRPQVPVRPGPGGRLQ